MNKIETVELTEEDCLNILKWWTGTSMMVEAKIRMPFSELEHETIAKISKVREKLRILGIGEE